MSDTTFAHLRFAAEGQFRLSAQLDPAHAAALTAALHRAAQIYPHFLRERFVTLAREAGVPESAIEACAESVSLDDHCRARPERLF